MNQEQADRLLKLASFLRTEVPPDKFDMKWFTNARGDGICLQDCGTTACALGWATVVFPGEFHFDGHCGTIRHKGMNDTRTVIYSGKFFGVSTDFGSCESDCEFSEYDDENEDDYSEWSYLFGDYHIRTPAEEADIIENFVASKMSAETTA